MKYNNKSLILLTIIYFILLATLFYIVYNFFNLISSWQVLALICITFSLGYIFSLFGNLDNQAVETIIV